MIWRVLGIVSASHLPEVFGGMSGTEPIAASTKASEIGYAEFEKVDLRVGRVVAVEEFARARRPSYRVEVDLGPEIGRKWSSVGVRREYTREEMLGRQVIAVVNFPPKNVAGFLSQVLILGVPTEEGDVSLHQPSRPAKLGGRVY
jgi:tRNA-binding protein